MRKIGLLAVNLVMSFCVVWAMSLTALAASDSSGTQPVQPSPAGTILPATETSVRNCVTVLNGMNNDMTSTDENVNPLQRFKKNEDQSYINEILACGIKTGGIRLWMIPYYIRYILQFIVGLAGLIAVGGMVYGGYLYLFAGVADDKDKGKKAIMYGVVGLVLTLVAWAIVNIVMSVVTG